MRSNAVRFTFAAADFSPPRWMCNLIDKYTQLAYLGRRQPWIDPFVFTTYSESRLAATTGIPRTTANVESAGLGLATTLLPSRHLGVWLCTTIKRDRLAVIGIGYGLMLSQPPRAN